MKARSNLLLACTALVACAVCAEAAAQTLYKLIDKNGKVTYAEKPPKEGTFDGKVIRMDIDPKANTATLPKHRASPAAAPSATSAGGGGDRVQSARDRLDAAKKALQDATDNPREDEIQRVGNKGGFTRPVPTEEYQKRLEGLKENVRKAEEDLRVAEGR